MNIISLRALSVIFFSLSTLYITGQIPAPFESQIAASPEAATLFKYADIPVDYHTGTHSVNVPITSISSGALNVPVSLSYHASGNRVSDVATWVGLGWKLNAGGMISRKINGLPDDDARLETAGFLDFSYNNSYEDLVQSIQDGNDGTIEMLNSGCQDSKPDDYYFNVNGLSGRFTFDWAGNRVIESEDAVSIDFNTDSNGLTTSWTIVDSYGRIYTFAALEITSSHTNAGGGNFSLSAPCNIHTSSYISSWFLTSIQDPFVTESTIQFNYLPYTIERERNYNETRLYKISSSTECGGDFSGQLSIDNVQYTIHSKRLTSIASPHSNQVIDFEGETLRSDVFGIDGIQNLVSLDRVKKYVNSQLLSQFELRYNYTPRLQLTSFFEVTSNFENSGKYIFDYDDTPLPGYNSKSVDHWGYFNGIPNTTLLESLILPIVGTLRYFPGADRSPDESYSQASILTGVTYPTGGRDEFEYEGHSYSRLHNHSSEFIDTETALEQENEVLYCENSLSEYSDQLNLNSNSGSGGSTSSGCFVIEGAPGTPVQVMLDYGGGYSVQFGGVNFAPKCRLIYPSGTSQDYSLAYTGNSFPPQQQQYSQTLSLYPGYYEVQLSIPYGLDSYVGGPNIYTSFDWEGESIIDEPVALPVQQVSNNLSGLPHSNGYPVSALNEYAQTSRSHPDGIVGVSNNSSIEVFSSTQFTIMAPPDFLIPVEVSYSGANYVTFSGHQFSPRVQIYSTAGLEYEKRLQITNDENQPNVQNGSTHMFLGSGVYTMELTIPSQPFTTGVNHISAEVNWRDSELQNLLNEKPLGGVRIRAIRTYSEIGSEPITRFFEYTGLGGNSSGHINAEPEYLFQSWSGVSQFALVGTGALALTGNWACGKAIHTGSSFFELAGDRHVGYTEVREYIGEYGEYGMNRYRFNFAPDIVNMVRPFGPPISNGHVSGKLTNEESYRFNHSTNEYELEQSNELQYQFVENEVPRITATFNFNEPEIISDFEWWFESQYNVWTGPFRSGIAKPILETTKFYPSSGDQNFIESYKEYVFNPNLTRLQESTTSLPDGRVQTQFTVSVGDMIEDEGTAYGPQHPYSILAGESGYNMSSSPLASFQIIDNQVSGGSFTTYSILDDGDCRPLRVFNLVDRSAFTAADVSSLSFINTNLLIPQDVEEKEHFEPSLLFSSYSPIGKVEEVKDRAGISYSAIFGYGGDILLAHATNAHHDEIGYSGFESDDVFSWGLNPSSDYIVNQAYLGEQSILIGGDIGNDNIQWGPSQNFTLHDTEGSYIMSCRVKTESLYSDNAIIAFALYDGESLVSNTWQGYTIPESGNGWTLVEVEYNLSELSIAITSNLEIKAHIYNTQPNEPDKGVLIDELKFQPADAYMATSNFDTYRRLTDMAGPNGLPTSFSYDNFNRLSSIRDHQGYIRSQFRYNLRNQ